MLSSEKLVLVLVLLFTMYCIFICTSILYGLQNIYSECECTCLDYDYNYNCFLLFVFIQS